MHKTTSDQRKSFKLYALASTAVLLLGASLAAFAGAIPTPPAELLRTVNPQIAAFMVPLTMLVFAILFEAARMSWRGMVPKQAVLRRDTTLYWRPGRGEG